MTLQLACQAFADPDDIYGDTCACSLDEHDDAELVAFVIESASDILVQLSQGRVHGLCVQTVRPFKVDGFDCEPHGDFWDAMVGGIDAIPLRGPDCQVIEVVIDGVVLNPTEYGLLNGNMLFRREGSWPTTNSVTKLSDEAGVFEVTQRFGHAADFITKQACIELACQMATEFIGRKSSLPKGTVSANIQGASVALDAALKAEDGEIAGLPRLSRFYAFHCNGGLPVADVWSPELTHGWQLVTVAGASGS